MTLALTRFDAGDRVGRRSQCCKHGCRVQIDRPLLVLDGEVAVFDKEFVSRFHLLGDNDDSGILCTPPVYIGFDVPQVGRRESRPPPPIGSLKSPLASR